MRVEIADDLADFVHDAVRAGHYAREDDVVRDALIRLKRELPPSRPSGKVPEKRARRTKTTRPKRTIAIDELHQQMLASGLISRLPDTAADFDDPEDEPIAIEGEPLSATIIRERR